VHKSRITAIIALLTIFFGGVLSAAAPAQALADSPWGGQVHQPHHVITAGATPRTSDDSPWGFH
jgi:hypothetical protein